jgi:hypothetical protein
VIATTLDFAFHDCVPPGNIFVSYRIVAGGGSNTAA